MPAWTDIATWSGAPADNFGNGDWQASIADRMTGHRGLVVHIAEGTFSGTISWERNPASDISSHFVLARDGRCAQMLDTDMRPWTQGAGNDEWLSAECEGHAGQALTPQQVEVCAQLLARAHTAYGVPLQLADSPSGRGLGWHGMGGTAWGGHTGCPGAPILAQRPAIITRAQQLIEGEDMSLSGDDLKAIVQNVTSAMSRGAWRDGYTSATFDAGYRGGPTLQTLADQLLVASAADETRDRATAAAVGALADLVRAGGGQPDTAAILARIDEATAAESRVVGELLERVADLQVRLAAAGSGLTGGAR